MVDYDKLLKYLNKPLISSNKVLEGFEISSAECSHPSNLQVVVSKESFPGKNPPTPVLGPATETRILNYQCEGCGRERPYMVNVDGFKAVIGSYLHQS